MYLQLRKLYKSAFDCEKIETRLCLLQEGERIAADFDDEWPFLFRLGIARTAKRVGQPALSIAAFTKCLYDIDHNPNLSHYGNYVIANYQSIVTDLSRYPHATIEQMESLIEDLHRRLLQGGLSLRAYYALKSTVAFNLGRLQQAHEYSMIWFATGRESSSVDKASEINFLVYRFAGVENWTEVLRQAEPFIQGTLPRSSTFFRTVPMIAKALHR